MEQIGSVLAGTCGKMSSFSFNSKLPFVVVCSGKFRTCACRFPGERSEGKPGVLTEVVPCCACTDGLTTVAPLRHSSPSCLKVKYVTVSIRSIQSVSQSLVYSVSPHIMGCCWNPHLLTIKSCIIRGSGDTSLVAPCGTDSRRHCMYSWRLIFTFFCTLLLRYELLQGMQGNAAAIN